MKGKTNGDVWRREGAIGGGEGGGAAWTSRLDGALLCHRGKRWDGLCFDDKSAGSGFCVDFGGVGVLLQLLQAIKVELASIFGIQFAALTWTLFAEFAHLKAGSRAVKT